MIAAVGLLHHSIISLRILSVLEKLCISIFVTAGIVHDLQNRCREPRICLRKDVLPVLRRLKRVILQLHNAFVVDAHCLNSWQAVSQSNSSHFSCELHYCTYMS